MDCSQYHDAIQDLAEGTLGPVRRAALQTHLDQCDACRELAADLQKIHGAAAELPAAVPPPQHVWLQIAGRLRSEGRVSAAQPGVSRRFAVLALAAALVLAIGGALYLVVPGDQPPESVTTGAAPRPSDGGSEAPADNAAAGDPVQSIADDFAQAQRLLDSAVGKLEEVAKANDDTIDPEMAVILKRNFQVIDQAIAESRAALKAEPHSTAARDSLFEALRRKVTLLQDTVALMNEMRKGNSAGAAQIIDGKS